ncbi:MAG: phage tail tape measure protein [Rhodobacteraceae bacterium]|nr:phage tail tape measure protein [Paracoccaceae bacterium]
MDEIEDFDAQVAALAETLRGAGGVAAAFDGEMQRLRGGLLFTGREVDTLGRSVGVGLRRAFEGLVFDGVRLSDALRQVASRMADAAFGIALRPVQSAVGGAVAEGLAGLLGGVAPFARGGAFAQGRVMPFAQGGIVSGPVAFPIRGGRTGLMGEAGPEAILPLARGADGRLGVQGGGGGRAVNVVINVATPDVEGFARSRGQIAAQVSRALASGARNR